MNAGDLYHVIDGRVDGGVDGGRGAIVFVHGSWTDHASWQFVRPLLADDNVVVAYDRRGHSHSGPVDGRGTSRVQENDLIEIVERLDRGPVHLAGNSYGGSIALGVAARRPDLVRSVTAHEPPLVGVVDASDEWAGELGDTMAAVLAVTADVENTVRAGDVEAGVRRFVEDLALGAGTWDLLPKDPRSVMVANAPSFLEMLDDPDLGAVPVVGNDVPLLLTDSDASPPGSSRRPRPSPNGNPTPTGTPSPAPATCRTSPTPSSTRRPYGDSSTTRRPPTRVPRRRWR